MEYYIYKNSADRANLSHKCFYVYPVVHYCEHCNTESIFWFEYNSFPTYGYCQYGLRPLPTRKERVENESWNLINHYFASGSKFTDSMLKNFSTKCWNDGVDDYKEFDKFTYKDFKDVYNSKEFKLVYENRNKIIEFLKAKKCPICGVKYSENPNHHFASFDVNNGKITPISDYKYNHEKTTFDDILSPMRDYRRKVENEISEQLLENLINQINAKIENKTFENKTVNDDSLVVYIKHLFNVEKEIFSLSNRLKELYFMRITADKDALASEKLIVFDSKNKLEEEQKKLKKINQEEVTVKIEDFPVKFPAKPKAPIKPTAPELQVPGFLNKKKIMAQNDILTTNYKNALLEYETEYKIYQCAIEKYNLTISELEKERENKYLVEVEKVKNQQIEKYDKQKYVCDKLTKEIKELEKSAKKIATPQKAFQSFIIQEITQAEELFEKLLIARQELYSHDVVFEKYRNLVAISSLYEYLSSGRCDTLKGHEGAYNIYENEVRMNMITSQLTDVIESLEDIKNNQHMIYSAIQETNKLLSSLNASMNKAVGSLSTIKNNTVDMKTYMSKIADNTEVIAYNTEVTAFYSKKNAELTNALGYLVALS